MTGPPLSPEERDVLAAEFALGVLEGDDLAAARRLAATDPDFREEVTRWSARLAPMLAEVEAVEPAAELRARIGGAPAAPGATIHSLTRRLRLWRGVSAGATALAAALALFLLAEPPRATEPAPGPPPMVAMLGDEAAPAQMVAAWDPGRAQLTVMSAAAPLAEPGRSHELWVIPADGTPRSLGVMPAEPKMQLQVRSDMLGQLAEGATLAVSVEPAGGSPTGAPTGPVIASGKLERA